MSGGFAVAQVNIALPREPLDSPALAAFVAELEPVNALASLIPDAANVPECALEGVLRDVRARGGLFRGGRTKVVGP
jgi:Domain of unknown function (DUF3291)